jgi:serine/threonine protein kinase
MTQKLSSPVTFETTFGTYTADCILGQGGSGRVLGARSEAGEEVALKLLDESRATSAKKRRFQNELQFLQRSDHLNLVKVLDYGKSNQARFEGSFYVMPRYA